MFCSARMTLVALDSHRPLPKARYVVCLILRVPSFAIESKSDLSQRRAEGPTEYSGGAYREGSLRIHKV